MKEDEDLELAKIGLHVLSRIYGDRQEHVRIRLADLMATEFRECGVEPPSWIHRLRDEPWEGSERD